MDNQIVFNHNHPPDIGSYVGGIGDAFLDPFLDNVACMQ